MGCPAAVVYAQIVMFGLESPLVIAKPPILYKRFIDDIFALFASLAEAQAFITQLNAVHPSFKITAIYDSTSVNFMDLVIYKGSHFPFSCLLDTKVYTKPNNPFLYLPFNSAHPLAVKKGFIKGRLISLVRSSSTFEAYLQERLKLVQRLTSRAYPFSFLQPILASVTYAQREKYLESKSRHETPMPLVLTLPYNQRTLALKPSSLVRKHWKDSFKEICPRLTRPPLICFRKSHSLRFFVKQWTPKS